MSLDFIITKSFLKLSTDFVMVPLYLIGFMSVKRDKWAHAMALMTFTMLYNFYLKNIFQIPLENKIYKTYAYPSGHMAATVAFYGSLIFSYRNIYARLFFTFIILCSGYAILYFNYHTLQDLLGACLFVFPVLLIYHYTIIPYRRNHGAKAIFILGLLALVFLLLIFLHNFTPQRHVFTGLYCTFGIAIGWYLAKIDETPINILGKIILLVTFGSLTLASKNYGPKINLPLYIVEAKWLIINSLFPILIKLFQKYFGVKNVTN